MFKTKSRIQETAEVFTPLLLVNEILDKLEQTDPTMFTDPNKTFLDNSCGSGQFLIEVVRRKRKHRSTNQQIFDTVFGVDIMVDNVCDTIARIIFFLEWGINIFDEKGIPNPELTEFGGYEEKDNADCKWLENNPEWERVYKYKDYYAYTRPSKKWWIIEYRTGKKFEKFKPYNNIICADALKYKYRFDDSPPYDN